MDKAATIANDRPASAVKSPCATCTKPIGILRCEGCQKYFCRLDFNQHRSELTNQLDILATDHDQFNQTLKQTAADPRAHALINRVDTWEKESRAKIKQVASELRHQIETHTTIISQEVSTRFREMVDRLQKAKREEDYDERDLKRWTEQLEQIKENFTSPSYISLEETPEVFIAKLQLKDLELLGKKFKQICNYAQIQNEGSAVLCTRDCNNGGHVWCQGEFSRGIHKIRINLEKYSNGSLFFGMNSKSCPFNNNSLGAASSYGWMTTANTVYINGQCLNNHKEYVSDYQMNDIVELELDCYRRKLRISNERSKKQHELFIDLEKCPFPWVFHFILSTCGDRLSIVP